MGIIELGGGFTQPTCKPTSPSSRLATPTVTAVSVDGGQERAHRRCERPGRRGHARHRGRRGDRARRRKSPCISRPTPMQAFWTRSRPPIHDTTNKPSVISISWGGAESTWTEPGDDGDGRGVPGGGHAGRHDLRRLRRQRLERWRDRRRAITSIFRPRALMRSPAAARA